MKLDTPKNKENNLEHTVNWETKSIKSLCLKVTSGGTPSRKNPAFYEEGTIPWLKTKELKDWYIDDSEEKITLEALKNSSAKIFPQNTVLMAMYGDGKTITSLGILRIEAATNQACCALIANPEVCDYLFLFYSLKFHRQDFISMASGGSQRNLNGQLISNFTIKVPSLETQRKITFILSNYDYLIENNTRRIEILEQIAKLVYEEWFVKFRFPGHEKVKMISSELGEIPEGWKVEKLGDICHIVMGQSPKSEFYNETGEGLPFHQGVTNFGDRFPIDKVYCTVLNRIAEKGDILFSVRAPVGRINIANKKIVIGRGLCSIRSKTGNQAFMFQQLKNKFQIEDSMGGGTIFKSVTKNDMHEIKVIFPLPSLISKFEVTVQPIFQSLEILTLKNQNLRKTRDLLLPKLISGEIDVSDLDIHIKNEYQEHNFNFGEPQDEKELRFKMV